MDLQATKVSVTIHRAALDSIFNECDRYDRDETGGRLIGTYKVGLTGRLSILVTGIIEPGPSTRRSPSTLYQDGEYQESVFRAVESEYPEIEHLGNWHTHHVNGYPTLSGGDRTTYHRIVNHPKHNTHFFYALLVTARNDDVHGDRYTVKHFILRRDNPNEYEIPPSKVRVVDRPIVWPRSERLSKSALPETVARSSVLADQRAIDSAFFKQVQPGLKPYLSKNTGKVYWRGHIPLINDSSAEIVVAELDDGGEAIYGLAVKGDPAASMCAALELSRKRFDSAREAVVLLERALNREIFQSLTRHEGSSPP